MNPCRQRGFSAPPKRFMYRLHKRRISTFFTPFFFFSFACVSFFFFLKEDFFFFFSSYCRHRTVTLALGMQARRLGRQHPPGSTFCVVKKKNPKKMKSEQKTNKKKSSRIDHLGKRLVPSGQTVLLDFSYSNREKKNIKKKLLKKS